MPFNLRRRLTSRATQQHAAPDLTSLRRLEPAKVIRQLGLIESAVRLREQHWWRPPARVLVTEATTAKLEWLSDAAGGVDLVSAPDEPGALAAVDTADAIVGWCTPEMIRRARELRWLQMDSAGVDGITHISAPLQDRGILVTNLQRVAAPAVAEHAVAMLLQLMRSLHEFGELKRRRRWEPQRVGNSLQTLSGKTVVIAGFGGIGSGIARIMQGFGACIVATRASQQPAHPELQQVKLIPPGELAGALASAAVAINALPLTMDTRGLFDEKMFRNMNRGCLFVNVGRGATVVTGDLVAALRSGHIGGAALDVVSPEPLPRSHPLWRLNNVVLTPHVAGRTQSTLEYEWLVVKENLRRYAAGERLLNVVDIQRNY